MSTTYSETTGNVRDSSPEQARGIARMVGSYCNILGAVSKGLFVAGLLAAEELGRYEYTQLHTIGYTGQTHTNAGVAGLLSMVLGAFPASCMVKNRDRQAIAAAQFGAV